MTYSDRFNITVATASGELVDTGSSSTPEMWAREKILERTTKQNLIPLFYRQCFQYIQYKLGTLSYMTSEDKLNSVICIAANPERAVAILKKETNIVLPIISISAKPSDDDDKRRRGAPQIVSQSFWSEKKKRAVRVISTAPRPVNVEYQINIWSKYVSDLDQLAEQIRIMFNPHMIVRTEYSNSAQAYIRSENDLSETDMADREDRIIRRQFTITLEGYVPNPSFIITSTGEIEEFNADITIH